MDKLDIAILREMSQAQAMLPARVGLQSSYRDMSKKIGSSAGTIRNRVAKMYSAGLLSGSSVYVNPAVLGMKGGAYALDVSPEMQKTDTIVQLKTVENILFIHNFRGSQVGILFVYEDENGLEDVINRVRSICGAKAGILSHVDYPPCSISLNDREWRLIFLLSEDGFHSYSQISKKLKVSVRTVIRRLQILRSEGVILSAPELNYRAIRGGVATDVIVVFANPGSKEQTERKIMPLLNDYLIFMGVGKEYTVYNLILPSIAIATELSDAISKLEGVAIVRAELVDEHIDVTNNLLGFVRRRMSSRNIPSNRTEKTEKTSEESLSASPLALNSRERLSKKHTV